MQLRDIVDLEMMYGDDAEAMVYDEFDAQVDDLDTVAKELEDKDNLDDIDDDIDDDIELEDAVDEGGAGRVSASVSAMEEALMQPVLEILTKISSYYDDLKKIQC